eukprot:260526_1
MSKVLLFAVLIALIQVNTAQSCRYRTLWPFANTSIWNMPIGSDAKFTESHLFDEQSSKHPLPNNFFGDVDFFYSVNNESPMFKWYNQAKWGPPLTNASYCTVTGNLMGEIHFPSNIIIDNFGNNNAAAILQPDNVTLYQMQPIYHCTANAPILAADWCFKSHNESILSNGLYGCHSGSGLSSIGGTIRKGELTDNNDIDSIKHALKLEFSSADYLYKGTPCYVWPAVKCDSPDADNKYFAMGSLLAVPSHVKITNYNLTTVAGKKILYALQNYGGYVVDDTVANRGTMCIEYGVAQEFQNKYGYSFNAKKGTAFYNDLLTIFKALQIVINNSASSVGGGGTPLKPLAPPICGAYIV